jgi:hypothetical protein
MTVGILAFGSIVDDPRADLEAVTLRRIETRTPFPVEFARASRTRHGAPTLIPADGGGARIPAVLVVLDDAVTILGARALLYQRETGRQRDARVIAQAGWIAELPGFAGTSACLYTALRTNIPPPLTGKKLAELALRSAASPSGVSKRDGISYLAQQKRRRVVTPLMKSYEEALLAATGARGLEEAWQRARDVPSFGDRCAC